MPSLPTVRVAGANGRLGKFVVASLQSSTYKSNFGQIVALVRETAPQDVIDTWRLQGVTVRIKALRVGSPNAKISFTAREDFGKAMAALASLSPKDVPEEIHIAGDTASFRQILTVVENAGGGPIQITQLDMAESKENLMKEPLASPGPYLRFIMGENKSDHSKLGLGCDNELVNPGEGEWKWTTLADLQEAK